MATRQARIDDFTHSGMPPADQPFELLCEDHVGTYVIPFLCRWRSGGWRGVDTNSPIEATVVGWRVRSSNVPADRPIRGFLAKVEIDGV